MSVSFQEIGHMTVTLPSGSAKAGQVCKVDTAGKAAACAAGERFCGVAETVGSTVTGVQLHGFVTAVYSGTAPTKGYVNLSANGTGGVKVDTAGASYLCVSVDTAAKTVTFEL